MKTIILLLLTLSLATAQDVAPEPGSAEWKEIYSPAFTEPDEIPFGSPLRKELFDLLRGPMEKAAEKKGIKFDGQLKAFKNWAFFSGQVLDAAGEPIVFPPVDNTDAAALWLRTRAGWRLVDFATGFGDPAYWIWVEQYGVPPALVGRE